MLWFTIIVRKVCKMKTGRAQKKINQKHNKIKTHDYKTIALQSITELFVTK